MEIKTTILREFMKCLFWKVMSFLIGGLKFASNGLLNKKFVEMFADYNICIVFKNDRSLKHLLLIQNCNY